MDRKKLRKSIVKTIQLLAADCNQKLQDFDNLTEAWHINLEEVTDTQIGLGLKKALEVGNKFMITSGEFKRLALQDNGRAKALLLIEKTRKYLN